MGNRYLAAWLLIALVPLASASSGLYWDLDAAEELRVGGAIRACATAAITGDATITSPSGASMQTPDSEDCVAWTFTEGGLWTLEATIGGVSRSITLQVADDAAAGFWGASGFFLPFLVWFVAMIYFLSRENVAWLPAFATLLGVMNEAVSLPLGRIGVVLLTVLLFWAHILILRNVRSDAP